MRDDIAGLIARSSLGTPDTVAARARPTDEQIRAVLRRVDEETGISMSALPDGTLRRCDYHGCAATYDAAAVMTGRARADGWIHMRLRGEHYCPEHRDSAPIAALRRLAARHGDGWYADLADQDGPWTVDDLRDMLLALPTPAKLWQRMAAEVLALLDSEVTVERVVSPDDPRPRVERVGDTVPQIAPTITGDPAPDRDSVTSYVLARVRRPSDGDQSPYAQGYWDALGAVADALGVSDSEPCS